MKYLKIGPVKIPYMVKEEEHKKTLQISGVNIPYSDFEKDGKVYYKIAGITFRIPGREKLLLGQSSMNFSMRDQWDEKKIQAVVEQIFEERLGYQPNLEDPKSFNEKIFWFKLNYHDPMITKCCDKYAVKEYVDEKLGPGHVVPTIKKWDSAEEIDFSILPDRYVIKVNWSSGYNIIVKNASTVNEQEIRDKVAHWMQPEQNSYYQAYNWGYKDMKPVVYAEEYMEQIAGQLYDYKFYCCGGKAKFLFIATDRVSKDTLTYDFYDIDFKHLDFHYGGKMHSQVPLEKPRYFDEMVRCAEILAEPFPFVRVDFYETADGFFVGEMTFYSGGGVLRFDPREWDYTLGSYIDLPEKKI